MSNLETIQQKTKAYADDYTHLSDLVAEANAEIESVQRRFLRRIKNAVNKASETKADLVAHIEANPELFEKPRTHVFHGIKVGLKKAVGKLEWEDDDQVVALIEKKLTELADTLIITSKKPSAKALEGLDTKDLKSIGVSCVETGDVPVVKPIESNVDKVVKALLKAAGDELGEG